jgi:hypothetical protein
MINRTQKSFSEDDLRKNWHIFKPRRIFGEKTWEPVIYVKSVICVFGVLLFALSNLS